MSAHRPLDESIASTAAPVQVDAIEVRTGRIACTVSIPEPRFRYTSPQLAVWVRKHYPDVAFHACVNDRGPLFDDDLDHTPLPHLLEHLTISIQARQSKDPQASFVGTTEWVDEGNGKALVQVDFVDDLAALRAFNEAVKVLNEAVILCIP